MGDFFDFLEIKFAQILVQGMRNVAFGKQLEVIAQAFAVPKVGKEHMAEVFFIRVTEYQPLLVW